MLVRSSSFARKSEWFRKNPSTALSNTTTLSCSSLSIAVMISLNSRTNCGPMRLSGGLSNITRQQVGDCRFNRTCADFVIVFTRFSDLRMCVECSETSIRSPHRCYQTMVSTESLRRVAARRARDDLHLCLIASTPMKVETRFTASGERSRIRDARPHPKEPRMSATVLSTFSRGFRRGAAGLAASLALGVLSAHAQAQPTPFPADFRSSQVVIADATINVRVGGHGPAVVLIHGFGTTGDMWSPMAAALAKDHTVVVPDLRGMGLSSHPAGGYDKWTQAGDIRAVLDKLGIDGADIVGHDIGVMVAYAYAARYPDKTSRLVVIDSPIPGIPPWNQIVRLPALWHFNFGGPDAERLVAGRERIYLDRFWNEFAGDPSKIDEATRVHYTAFYAQPGAMHSAFAQFLSIPKDAEDNKVSMTTKLTMPVLAIGGAKSFGANVAIVMRNAADNVTEVMIANSGHWLMDEQPTATIAAVHKFLDRKAATQSH